MLKSQLLRARELRKQLTRQLNLLRNLTMNVHKFDKKVEDAIEKVEEKIAFDIPKEQQRFFAIKLLERDDKIKEQMKLFRTLKMKLSS